MLNAFDDKLKAKNFRIRHHTCSTKDDFKKVMFSLIDDTELNRKVQELSSQSNLGLKGQLKYLFFGFRLGIQNTKKKVWRLLAEKELTPNVIANYFKNEKFVFVIDEFDRIKDDDTNTLILETIQTLSAKNANTRIILCGINLNLSRVFSVHESIKRNCITIRLNVINNEDIGKIIYQGISKMGITFDPVVIKCIKWISCGSPFVAKFLASALVNFTLETKKTNLSGADFICTLKNLDSLSYYERFISEYNKIIGTKTTSEVKINAIEMNPFDEFFELDQTIRNNKSLILKDLLIILSLFDGDIKQSNLTEIQLLFDKINLRNEFNLTASNIDTIFEFVSIEYPNFLDNNKFYTFPDPNYKSFLRIQAIINLDEREKSPLLKPFINN